MSTTRFVTVTAPDGEFRAYQALPGKRAGQTLPAVLLLPEIYNINGWIRLVAERYAARGHEVLVPDLFWRQAPEGVDLEYTPQDQQRGRVLSANLDRPQAVADLKAAASWLRQERGADAVASVGFCLGGELAYLGAADGSLDAAVAYYPTRMENHLQHGPAIDVPLLVHIGELDHRTPPGLVQALSSAVAGKPRARIEVYDGADHGFGRFGHPPFHAASADLAEKRTWDLLSQLGGAP